MTQQELKALLRRLGLKVPKNELDDITQAITYLDEMIELIKKPRPIIAERARVVSFPSRMIYEQ